MKGSINSVLRDATRRLHALGDGARLEAEVLLAHCLDAPRSHLHAWPEKDVSAEVCARLSKMLERRASGEPLAYLVGEKEFWSLSLQVNAHTLIPRPETELLVSEALKRCPPRARVLELGTGSGAIAIALASERPDATVLATELSSGALDVAAANARRHGVTNIQFGKAAGEADWFGAAGKRRFDLLISNPPYVEDGDPGLRAGGLSFEPRGALAAGPDGLRELARIIEGAPARLVPNAWLLLEHGSGQADAVSQMMRAAGFSDIATSRDLAGLQRVTLGKKR